MAFFKVAYEGGRKSAAKQRARIQRAPKPRSRSKVSRDGPGGRPGSSPNSPERDPFEESDYEFPEHGCRGGEPGIGR